MPEQKKSSLIKDAMLDNPILIQAVGLTPAVIATTNLRVALWVAAITAVHLVLCETLACLWLKKWPDWLRNAAYLFLGIVLVFGTGLLLELRDNVELTALRWFLPLLAASSLSAARSERFAIHHTLRESLRDAAVNAIGFAVVVVVVGALRESLGHGTLFGWEFMQVRVRAFWMPFAGFLLLGAMAAALKIVLQWMSSRGLAKDAPEVMEMVPEDRIERLEKIHRLLQEAEKYEENRKAAAQQEQEKEEEPVELGPRAPTLEELIPEGQYSSEDKERLDRALEELLKDFERGNSDE